MKATPVKPAARNNWDRRRQSPASGLPTDNSGLFERQMFGRAGPACCEARSCPLAPQDRRQNPHFDRDRVDEHRARSSGRACQSVISLDYLVDAEAA
jgi:hypothetical protein